MTAIMNWLKGRRVFPRWKLIALVLIGAWVGFMLALDTYLFAIIFGALMIMDLTKRASN